MQENYKPLAIEQEVHKAWEESGVFNVAESSTQDDCMDAGGRATQGAVAEKY